MNKKRIAKLIKKKYKKEVFFISPEVMKLLHESCLASQQNLEKFQDNLLSAIALCERNLGFEGFIQNIDSRGDVFREECHFTVIPVNKFFGPF